MGRVRVLPTRNGLHFLSIAIFCVLGAVIRDLNLLVILAGLLFGLLVFGWRFCRRTLDRLEVNRTLPREVFAEQPFRVMLTVINHRRLMPGWLLRVYDSISEQQRGRKRCKGRVLISHIPPGASRSGSYEATIAQRGAYQCSNLEVCTDFPFGLSTGSVRLSEKTPFVVYPALGRLRSNWRHIIESRYAGISANRRRAGNSEGDFFGLRPWQNGDSRRWIHWRTSARLNELAVRQFEARRRDEIILVVDLHRPPEAAETDAICAARVERALCVAATIVESLTRAASTRIAFGIAGKASQTVEAHLVYEVRREALTSMALAQMAPVDWEDLRELTMRLAGGPRRHWPILVVSTRPAPPTDLFRLFTHATVRWIDVGNADLSSLIQLSDSADGESARAANVSTGERDRDAASRAAMVTPQAVPAPGPSHAAR